MNDRGKNYKKNHSIRSSPLPEGVQALISIKLCPALVIILQTIIGYYWEVLKNNYKKALAHFNKVDPKIFNIARTVDYGDWFSTWRDPLDEKNYFAALCRDIVGQQLATGAARAIHSRFLKLFGRKKVTPENLLKVADHDLRDAGLSWAKVKYTKDLASKVTTNSTSPRRGGASEVNLNNLDVMTDEEVVKELTKVKGIGQWTAEMFLIFTLGRENVFSHGDLGLRKGLVKVYSLRKLPLVDRAEKIVGKWSPYKSYGSVALWHALDQE